MVLKKLTVSALCLQMIFSSFAITAGAEEIDSPINWVSMYGEDGKGISTNPDTINDAAVTNNGILAAGDFDVKGINGSKDSTNASIMLYNNNGEKQWETNVGGSKTDSFNSAIVSSRGGYVAVGLSQSVDGDLENLNKGGNDSIIAKFDNSGALEKIATFGGTSRDGFKDVIMTYDRGYVAVGYANSTDGDMAETGKTEGDGDAIIVKYDKDLNVQWVNRVNGVGGGSLTKNLDEFESVMTTRDGGYLAAGYTGAANGKKDALLVKFSASGEIEWQKTFGGSGDDVFTQITTAHNKSTTSSEESSGVSNAGGFVLTGTTKSIDGDFENINTEEKNHGFILKIDNDGKVIWTDTLENSSATTGEGIVTNRDGFVVTGTYSANDGDFTGQKYNNKEDMYMAYYSKDGDLLNITTLGGDGKDTAHGVLRTDDAYYLYGNTASTDGYFSGIKGKYDGFMASIDSSKVEYFAEEKYTVPVKALKASSDEESMMSPLLYKDSYVEKKGSTYTATIYFTNASIMGGQVNASSLGSVKYEKDGEMVSAERDEYDSVTQVKSVTITTKDLEKPILFEIENAMDKIRVSFDMDNMSETSNPPYFAPVEITQPDFANVWKKNIGGNSVDYTNDMAVLNNGNIVVVGETYSTNNEFADKKKGASSAFINEYSPSGNLLNTITLGGTQADSSAYGASVTNLKDGGYVVGGGYIEGVYVDPTGDFENLKTEETVHGKIDGFIAKYDSNHNLLWMNNFSGSGYDQVKQVKSTKDGGVVALIETNSTDGDMQDTNKGIYDLVVLKYDKDGNLQFRRNLGGKNIESVGFGITELSDGSIMVGGHLSSKSGDFADVTWYGDIFDTFAAKISSSGELLWTKAYGGQKNEYCNGVMSTSDGGFIMLGNTKSTSDTFEGVGTSYDNAFVVKCDKDGNVQWKDVIKSSENSELIRGIEVEDEYVFLGQSRGTDYDFNNLNKGSMDVFITTYDKSGNRTHLETIGGSAEEYAANLCKLNSNQISVLMYGDSNDGDMKDLNLGDYDGTLLTYNYKEVADTPQEPSNPSTPSNPDNNKIEDGNYVIDNVLPEGSMARDHISETTKMEVKDGKIYLTFTILSPDQMNDIKVKVNGEEVECDTRKTKSGTLEITVEVPNLDAKITMDVFIVPMGRRVSFDLSLNKSSMEEVNSPGGSNGGNTGNNGSSNGGNTGNNGSSSGGNDSSSDGENSGNEDNTGDSNGSETPENENVNTGDKVMSYVAAFGASVLLLGTTFILNRRKKSNK